MAGVKSYRSPKIEVKESCIHGKGIFAREPIKKGEIVAIKGGHILILEEFNKLPDILRQYCLQLDDNFFMGPKAEEEIPDNALFINLSCEPNVGLDGQIVYVALRDIKPGEELTHDYAMMYTKGNLGFKCKCGAKSCRGIVTDNDWKLKKLHKKYGDHFSLYILRKIKK